MDNKKSFEAFWHTALAFALVIITIAASAGCINYGVESGKFYVAVGILNLGWLYPVIRQAAKFIEKTNK